MAGNGAAGFSGDGGPAVSASFDDPASIAVTSDGGYLVADRANHRIRKVSASGLVQTVAGTGTAGYNGDNRPATTARLHSPSSVAVTSDGGYVIADRDSRRVRKVSPGGTITTIAGTGASGSTGDGGPAAAARLRYPVDVAVMFDDTVLVADRDGHRIRRIAPDGEIGTVAGTGTPGFSGDGGPATAAKLDTPESVDPMADGGFAIADKDNARVRRVTAAGIIHTAAGTGATGSSGVPGTATDAQLNYPMGVRGLWNGGLLVIERLNHRLLYVGPGNEARSLTGTGTAGFSGDGGAPQSAQLQRPEAVSVTRDGSALIADTGNERVRSAGLGIVRPPAPSTPPAASPAPAGTPAGLATDYRPPPVLPGRPPVAGKTFNSAAVSGKVLIKRPASRRAKRLGPGSVLPVGSTVYARKGIARVTASQGRGPRAATADFTGGAFKVVQRRGRRAIAELRLADRLDGCKPTASRRRKRRARGLWGAGKGKFRMRGRYGAATVRGTGWAVQDTCKGTLTGVLWGAVSVRDEVRRRSVLLRRGQSYLARPPARRR